MKRTVLLVSVLAGAVGCVEDPVDIGDAGGSGATEGGDGTEPADGTRVWEGYVERSAVPSGSDSVRLTMNGDGTGTLVFGVGDPPPPATDPDVGYPDTVTGFVAGENPSPLFPIEGYVYALESMELDSLRLQFRMNRDTVWEDWCSLQTPIVDQINGGFVCIPNLGFHSDDTGCYLGSPEEGNLQAIDCAKPMLCDVTAGVCQCDATRCEDRDATTEFTLTRTYERLDATIDLHDLFVPVIDLHLEER